MQSPCAVVALPFITMKAIAALNINLLLEVEVVLQSLILELLVKVLVLSTIDVIHDLLLKVALVLNRHGLATQGAVNSLLKLTRGSAMSLSALT